MTRWAIVADLNRCVGCQTCTAACKHANNTAPDVQWRKVLDFETGEFPDVRRAFVPVGCMHCEEPSCMDVCPSTATFKREDGIVGINYDICLGCAYCAVACPYQARFRVDEPAAAFGKNLRMRHETKREDPARLSVAQKCTLCVDRIDEGLAAGLTPGVDMAATPACVASCISGALAMGDLDDPESNVSRLLREKRHFRMHEELGNGPGFHYLYDGDIANHEPIEPAPMEAEPVGLAAVSPKLQKNWDWRAAANFTFGGTGTGLFAAAMVAGLFAPVVWLAVFFGLAFTGAGLFCVWLEIGRPWRFLNVFRNPRTSWMSREAIAAIPFFGLGGLSWLLGAPALGWLAAACGLFFLYCQARILRAAKGIPAWRQPGIVPLIVATGLTEGVGLWTVAATLWGAVAGVAPAPLTAAALALAVLIGLRALAWRNYRAALGNTGAPTPVFAILDSPRAALFALPQAGLAALALLAPVVPAGLGAPLLALAGLGAALSGWLFKYTLITKAAYNQGYALERMPARGAGLSAPGIKPGWAKA